MKSKITHRIRALLAEGPATIPEIAAEITDEPLRRIQVAMWVLTSEGFARKVGIVPGERRSKGNGIYALTNL